MSDYKDWFNERYAELAIEKYDREYWELSQAEQDELGRIVTGEATDYYADRIDAAHEEAKYRGIK